MTDRGQGARCQWHNSAITGHRVHRRLGWSLIGLASVALAAAGVVAITSGVVTASSGAQLAARALAALAALLFAAGVSVLLWAATAPGEPPALRGLTVTAILAVLAAASVTAVQLVIVNDTVSLGVRLALWVLVVTWLGAGGTAQLARHTARRRTRSPRLR